MVSRADDSLESLRRALQERGYLNRSMDRLMLRGAGSRLAWLRGALKAGLAAGLFLAFALLLALAIQNSPPITSPPEILLLGTYLAILCCLLALLVEIAAGLLGLALWRLLRQNGPDPGKIAWGIGSAAAVGFALYLALWWGGREEGSGALGTRVIVLSFILVLSLAIGRLTSMTALLSLIRVDRPLNFWLPGRRTGLVLLLVLLAVAALAIPWHQPGAPARAARPANFATSPRPGRVLWIGIDGLGTNLLHALIADGQLPNLSDLTGQGCSATLSRTPGLPPAIWVSAATGFQPQRHGVAGVESAVLPGIGTPLAASPWAAPLVHATRVLNPWFRRVGEVPLSGLHRKDKAVWEILAEKAIPSMVVNWWATWPAEEGPGIRISERAFFRLEAGGAPDREVFPPEEMENLQARFAREFPPVSKGSGGSAARGEGEGPAMDAFHQARAREGWEEGRWPLVAVYLNGVDLLAQPPSGPGDRARNMIRDRRMVEHLRSLDDWIGSLARAASADDFVLVEGDPGRSDPTGDDSGFLIITGPGVRSGLVASGGLLDVAPTLLRLLGFPRSREMTGHPLSQCFAPAAPAGVDDLPPVASYGARIPPARGESTFDPEVLQKLRSLGYIR